MANNIAQINAPVAERVMAAELHLEVLGWRTDRV
jgi:hypothetical protein